MTVILIILAVITLVSVTCNAANSVMDYEFECLRNQQQIDDDRIAYYGFKGSIKGLFWFYTIPAAIIRGRKKAKEEN